jgi:hypothetical protein
VAAAEHHQQQPVKPIVLNIKITKNMFIRELFEPTAPGYRDENDDNSVQHLSDLRKTKLTFAHINKLRMANDVRKFEHENKLKQVSKQYKPAPEGGGMAGGGLGI